MPAVGGLVFDSSGATIDREIRVYRRDTGALLGKTRSSGGDGDPHFDKVSLLLHMNGADGSTAFIDLSPSPKAINVYGNAKISAAQSKFGGTSAYFDGVGDYLAAQTDISNAQSWTGECWFKVPNLLSGSAYHTFFGRYPMASLPGRWFFGVASDGRLRLWCGPIALDAAVAVANDGAWHHAAVVVDRALSEVRIYLDGVRVGTSAILTFHLYGEILVGTYNPESNAEALNGYLQDVRLTMGVARYTANFLPPSARLPDIQSPGRTLAFGEYYFVTQHAGEVNVVCLDDASAPLENDLILRTFPV